MGAVRALLVGIDRYAGGVSDLAGCVNDIEAVQEVLPTLLSSDTEYAPLVLKNEQAGRQAVVDAFRRHFSPARAGDVALFWYSGHGSQQQSAPGSVEPDAVDETIVCHDSRAGSWDLADKELRTLVGEVSARGVEVLVVLDCCHSGSGVRTVEEGAVRQVPLDRRRRPPGTYLTTETRGHTAPVTDAAYVLLAGCAPHQTAKETAIDGVQRGAFSAALLQALAETGGRVSYADLIAWTAARVGRMVRAQDPQLEASNPRDAGRAFLGEMVAESTRSYRLLHDGAGWFLRAGTLHGIPSIQGGEKLLLSVRPGVGDDRAEVTTAQVVEVEPHRSRVIPDGPLDENGFYRAEVTAWPLPLVKVAVRGPADDVMPVQQALTSSRLARISDDLPDIEVEAGPRGYRVGTPRAGLRIAHSFPGHGDAAVAEVTGAVERIARWSLVRDLANRRSGIPAGSLRIEVETEPPSEKAVAAGTVRLLYDTEQDGSELPPRIRVSARNDWSRKLFVAMLFLDEEHAVENVLLDAAGEWVEPGGTLQAAAGEWLTVRVPDHLFASGVTEVKDWVKVIASTREFDVRELCDSGMVGEVVRSGSRDAPTDSPLDLLLFRAVRHIDIQRRDPGVEWQAVTQVVTVERPGPGVPLRAVTDLGNGLTLTAPASVTGRVRVATLETAVRDLTVRSIPPILDDPLLTRPLDLLPSRADSDLSVLELDVQEGAEGVDPDHPLLLRLPGRLERDEHVIPLVHDGEYWLPVGRVVERPAGGAVVAIESLPAAQVSERGLWTSVRVLFRKLVGRPLGLRYEHPVLAVATVEERTVRYESPETAPVLTSGRPILLYVHGIIGDTREMVERGAAAHPAYGAVLTFDYESIHTSIAENARLLRARLEDLGFGPDRRIDVVAHSMGGLVVRWMIEKEDGAALVRRAVLAGTPHDGSPWPTVQGWATTALGLALNGLTTLAWPLVVIGGLVQAVERVDDALDELATDSTLLKDLAGAADPGVPYTLVIGDTSLDDPAGRAPGLLERIRARRLLDAAAALAFFSKPNDLAVSVESAGAVPGPRTPAVDAVAVACDHMSYFSSPAGRAAIETALQRREEQGGVGPADAAAGRP